MKVLVVSHTVFSDTESMGKTLSGYFNGFEPDSLAQLYIHSQMPSSKICHCYFQFTDVDAIKSIFGLNSGKIFVSRPDGCHDNPPEMKRNDGVTAYIYQKGRKRTPLIYLMRNLWWKLSHWNSKKLKQWLDDFSPDCVFFASGDYAFMYDIAYSIAKSRNIPLYVSCMDDYYIHNKNTNSILGRFYYRYFMKKVQVAMQYSKKIFCICEKMSHDYSTLFNKDCITVHTPSMIDKPQTLEGDREDMICYLGNLGYKRDKQLIQIGRCLKELDLSPNHIDVYTTESRTEILQNLTEDNGIKIHGAVGAKEVIHIISRSLAVIHTESFDSMVRKSICYSVSTKIADSLASGTCIFAFGPPEIASMQYLIDNDAAVYCIDKDNLKSSLSALIQDNELRSKVIKNALSLAKNNHRPGITAETIFNELASETDR